MPLPYPTKVILPFDIATAQDMNERHANDVALAAGTGLDNGAITTNTLADSAVTAEKLASMSFRAYLSTAQTGLTDNTFTKAVLNAESWDKGSNFNTSTGEFVAPLAGVYNFSAQAYSSTATQILVALYVNGVVATRGTWVSNTASFIASTLSDDLLLAQGDEVEMWVYTRGATRNLNAGPTDNYMSGHYIGS